MYEWSEGVEEDVGSMGRKWIAATCTRRLVSKCQVRKMVNVRMIAVKRRMRAAAQTAAARIWRRERGEAICWSGSRLVRVCDVEFLSTSWPKHKDVRLD